MLEWQTSGNSNEFWLPIWNGKLMHSRRNPAREATLWVNGHRQQIEGSHTCFIFGLAGGFHIQELHNQFPELEIVVIEHFESFVNLASPLVRELLPNIKLRLKKDPYDLMKDTFIENCLKKTFSILEHAPSVSLSPDYYRNVRSAFCGRDWKSFNFHVKARGQSWMNQLNFAKREQGLISIKNITAEIEGQDEISPDMMKWLCLGELVK